MIHAKNDKIMTKFVKVMPRILWPLFFLDTVYNVLLTIMLRMLAVSYIFRVTNFVLFALRVRLLLLHVL